MLSFEKALVYCCTACIYFMPPQTVAKGRAWSVAVIREVGRECALRHREQLCSDTLRLREPFEELAISHAHTVRTETCQVQAHLSNKVPKLAGAQKSNLSQR